MRKLLTILFCFASIIINATDYYVKNGGNDGAAGTSDGTAWATIDKINTVWNAGTFAPGDNIYFNKGNSFTGTIEVKESGSSGNPITIGAYGTGADPIFNGFTTVTGWSDEGGGIYSKTVACESSNTVVVSLDGTHTAMGRWPTENTYYVSTTGDDDTGTGSITEPWATLAYGVNRMSPGDLLYIRGGTYRTTGTGASTVHSRWENVWGTAEDTIKIFAYPGEYPVFNLDNITMTSQYTFVVFLTNCRYLHVKGLRVTGMYQQPYGSEGTVIHNWRFSNTQHCKFEQLEVDHSGLWGFMLASGSHYNLFLNCDAHHLTDPYTGWDASDGFARTGGSTANYNTYRYCRAWLCCDDGWDHYSTDGYTTLEGCWAFWNGWSDENRTTHLGNGVGFKLGPGATNQTAATRVLTNCLSVQNYFHGFDQNFYEGTGEFASIIYNCTAYDNGGYGFRMRPYGTSNGSNADIIRNNIAFSNGSGTYLGDAGDTQDHNTWNGDVTLTSADFVSLDVSQLDDLRQADGSLPDITFGHLTTGSDLIDAGVDVGLPYKDEAPDMGWYEYIGGVQIIFPTVTTTAISNIQETTATGGGNVTSSGNGTVSARGVCWGIYSNPTITDDYTTDGTGTGSFTSSITGLTANTTYYVRAYATNSAGTSYGSDLTFKTSTIIVLPTLTTGMTTATSSTTATSGGNVTSDGGAIVTARGVCWSMSANPTISLSTKTSNGTGTGSFTSNITGLTANTTYHVRAYATNSAGTSYGSDVTITTPVAIVPPTVTTATTTATSSTTATSGGNVTSDGGATVTSRGVCWSTSANPTVNLSTKTSNGTGTGIFSSTITGLTENTTYYVRAYATNEIGTSYGSNKEFTTLEYEEPEPPPDIPKIILIDKDGYVLKSPNDNLLRP